MRKAPAFFVAATVAAGLAGPFPVASAAEQATIPQSHPQWATPRTLVADASPDQKMTFRVYLRMRNQDGAEATARAVSDPSSPSYRQYLNPAQVLTQYAADTATVSSVRNWLTASGFSLGELPANNAYVEATGTVDQTQKAFGVHLGEYSVRGMTLRAADQDLKVPAALGSAVVGVIGVDQATALLVPSHVGGLDDGKQKPSLTTYAGTNTVPPPAGFRNAPPCGSYFGEKTDTTDPAFAGAQLPYAPCGYKPAQLRSAYGIDGAVANGLDGRGSTVAIVDAFASPTLYADAAEYAKRNDPAYPLRRSQYRQIVFPANPALEGPDGCDAAGWYGEQTLDVEAVHATAPGANILYVGGSDCQDISLDKALNLIVAGRLANMVSNSYGDQGEDIPAAEVQAFELIAMQAAMEGIGLYFSSGDSGDESANLPQPSPDFSASSPWVTAVGGTSLGIGRDGRKVLETGWETGRSQLTNGKWAPLTYQYGSGGGTSRLFRQPFYQQGVVPDALARKNQTGDNRGRVVPDISMLGDPNTGMLIGITQTFPTGVAYGEYRIGGTSLSSPLFAGLVAVADQAAGYHHGFLNPVLYRFGTHNPAITDVQHVDGGVVRVDYVNGLDATGGLSTTVRTFDYPNLTIHTTPGYDTVTGLGVPSGPAFLAIH